MAKSSCDRYRRKFGYRQCHGTQADRDFGAIVLAARSGEKLNEVGQQVKAIGVEPLALELDRMAPPPPGLSWNKRWIALAASMPCSTLLARSPESMYSK